MIDILCPRAQVSDVIFLVLLNVLESQHVPLHFVAFYVHYTFRQRYSSWQLSR